MGTLPNPIKELSKEISHLKWALIIVAVSLLLALYWGDRRHTERENALEKRIETLEKEREVKR